MDQEATVKARPFAGLRIEVETPLAFDQVLARLRRLTGKASAGEIVALADEVETADDYVREVEQRYVGESGFILFAEIDHGAWIGKFGIRRRSLRWIFGNPLIAITMIRHDITAGLFAPVELLLTEAEDRKGCSIAYVRPSSLMVIGENAPLQAAAQALDEKLDALVARATNPRADAGE